MTLQPLTTRQSVLLFSISAGIFRLSVYHLMPYLHRNGLSEFWSFIFSYSLPLALMLTAAVVGVAAENNLACWRHRLRLHTLTWRTVGISTGLFAVSFLASGLLLPSAALLASYGPFAPPAFLPAVLNPLRAPPFGELLTFMGVSLRGAYWVLPVYFTFLTVFNIMGEEVWFRGYMLPRQELAWGKLTWLYHGLFWCLFHFPLYPWMIVYLLPTTLAVSYAAYSLKTTWGGFIVHYLGNGLLVFLPIALAVVK
ncbi:CPBP family intramembrane glutamic endopeptidase [Hymenobacter sp. APR13]|uniref:CPBP family intramembrane glutamic endopeptidase n=1 Tax=Hymenobacter sp. APR13 TaxID=1356852 RepID=UPI0026B67758